MKPFVPNLPAGHGRRERGVTLVELMVGLLIGLLAVLIITQVFLVSEGQRRTTTGGSDAQVNGALSLHTIQRDVQMAGYGLTSSPGILGCPINARFNSSTPTGFPSVLAPVVITPEASRPSGSIGDSIRVLSSSKTSYSVPTRVVPPAYAVGGTAFPVTSALGVEANDLALVATNAADPCWVFQVTSSPTPASIPRADNNWNGSGYPDRAYGDGSVLVNLGRLIDNQYEVNGNVLQISSFDVTAPSTRNVQDIQAGIVNMRAYYGKDTDNDGVVDAFDTTTPTTNAQWVQVLAVRVVLVARSEQYEKEAVTFAAPSVDVGTTPPTAGATTCGTSACITLGVSHLGTGTEWQHYRYKTFDTVIPLRNMLWGS